MQGSVVLTDTGGHASAKHPYPPPIRRGALVRSVNVIARIFDYIVVGGGAAAGMVAELITGARIRSVRP
jgi:hypothetical protein